MTTALLSCTLTELALSADNVMVWAIILRRLDIPARMHRHVVAAGIGIAVVLRVAAIEAGAVALERMSWLTYILGAVLVYTGWKLLHDGDSVNDGDSVVMRLASRVFRSPVVVAVVALGITDLVFAVDSIPASFGITGDPTTIIIANGIALAALWTMYGVVSSLMERLPYLSHGLAVVLAWIGATMLGHHIIAVPELVSLGVIAAVLGTAALASIRATRAALDTQPATI